MTQAEAIKHRLRRSGATMTDVARLAGVTWRMVHYVMHGQRKSAKVMRAIDKLTSVRQ